jgi:EAL domain-containing protein (putative c-di-GMP-specific phosphodiesterase class I)
MVKKDEICKRGFQMSIVSNKPMFSHQLSSEYSDLKNEFLTILSKKMLEIHFQPIISLKDGSIYGYEALSRGPIGSYFFSPAHLFPFAERLGYLYTLEKLAREQAFERSKHQIQSSKLFINISATVIHEPSFSPGYTRFLLEQYQLEPSNIVFEITERSAITDFQAFRKVIRHYRNQGFKIAVDDAGAGYSSLKTILELEPDYIKLDRSLISNIDTNEMKASIVEAFGMFAKKSKINILAEGIETAAELEKIKELGIDFGQGYYIGRPKKEVVTIPEYITDAINGYRVKKKIVYADIDDEIVILKEGIEQARTSSAQILESL